MNWILGALTGLSVIIAVFYRELMSKKTWVDPELHMPLEPLQQPEIAPPSPVPPIKPVPVEPKPDYVTALAHAIQSYEGFYPNSRSYRNQNPGNLRFASQPHTIGKDDKGFAIFDSYEHGLDALKTLIVNAATGKSKVYHPDMTLNEFMAVYAPITDDNDPVAYANWLSVKVGISSSTLIKNLV